MVVFVVRLLDARVHGDRSTGTLPVAAASPVDGAVLAVTHLVVAVSLEHQRDATALGGHVLTVHHRLVRGSVNLHEAPSNPISVGSLGGVRSDPLITTDHNGNSLSLRKRVFQNLRKTLSLRKILSAVGD